MNNFQELKLYTYRLYMTFLKKHIKSTSLTLSNEQEDSIKAFCLLSHAAIEEYIENLSTNLVQESYLKFKKSDIITQLPTTQEELNELNSHLSQLIISLVLSSSFYVSKSQNKDSFQIHLNIINDYSSENISFQGGLNQENINKITKGTKNLTKDLLSKTVEHFKAHSQKNHGISLKYLLKLLIPVGVDIPNNIQLLNSLQRLSIIRGNYAHTKGSFEHIIGPKDLVLYIIDTLKLLSLINKDIVKYQNFIKKRV